MALTMLAAVEFSFCLFNDDQLCLIALCVTYTQAFGGDSHLHGDESDPLMHEIKVTRK